MKYTYLWLLTLIFLSISGCGPADRGEPCGDNSHHAVECAKGLECVWQGTIQKQVCAAPGDEATHCEMDEDCNGHVFFCFRNNCQIESEEDESCVEDRQCKGDLLCSNYDPFYRHGLCWQKEKAGIFSQCYDPCIDRVYRSCLVECRAGGKEEVECEDICEFVELRLHSQVEARNCLWNCRLSMPE